MRLVCLHPGHTQYMHAGGCQDTPYLAYWNDGMACRAFLVAPGSTILPSPPLKWLTGFVVMLLWPVYCLILRRLQPCNNARPCLAWFPNRIHTQLLCGQ
jgi:hypothetical protein